MKHMLLAILIAASITGCGKQTSKEPKLQENTEEYFKAHGIVQGQVNELRIGGTLFRFPAGVGLNPYTATGIPVLANGTPEGIPLEKEPRRIVKGQADKVTFYLDQARGYAPNPSPFGGGVRVEISNSKPAKWDGLNVNPDVFMEEVKGRKTIDYSISGFRQFIAPTETGAEFYESLAPTKDGGIGQGKFFWCQSNVTGITAPTGLCFISYWNEPGQYVVEIIVSKSIFLEHWREIYLTAVRFVDSVAVK